MSDANDTTTALLQQHYARARLQGGSAACIAVLHLGAQQCGIAVGTGAQAQRLQLFPLGFARTAAEHFHTAPPTPLAMENAIQWVEDVVMPLRKLIPVDAQLFSCDAAVREIALLSGAGADAEAHQVEPLVLSLDAMERCFNRLVSVVQGRSAASEGLPASTHFAAALLILREFMHHLQFAGVTVLDGGPRT